MTVLPAFPLLTVGLRLLWKMTLMRADSRQEIKYDKAVLATGSYPFVPPTPGADKRGVFVYRTIEDLEVRKNKSNEKK